MFACGSKSGVRLITWPFKNRTLKILFSDVSEFWASGSRMITVPLHFVCRLSRCPTSTSLLATCTSVRWANRPWLHPSTHGTWTQRQSCTACRHPLHPSSGRLTTTVSAWTTTPWAPMLLLQSFLTLGKLSFLFANWSCFTKDINAGYISWCYYLRWYVQWGLENQTRKTERHPNSERFEVWFSSHFGGHFVFGFRMVPTIQKPN